MRLTDMIKMCFQNLWRRKVRTSLTVLGVVIGSCAIVVMISLGLGMNLSLEESLKEMGDLNVITVYPKSEGGSSGGGRYAVSIMSSGSSSGTTKDNGMNDENVGKISEMQYVSAVTPTLRMSDVELTLYTGKNNRYLARPWGLIGMDLSSLEKFGYKLSSGAYLTPEESIEKSIFFGSDMAYDFQDTKKNYRNNRVYKYKQDGTEAEPFFDPAGAKVLLTVNNTKAERDTYSYPSGGRRYEHNLKVSGVFEGDYAKDGTTYGAIIDIKFAKQLIEDFYKLNNVKNNVINYESIRVWVDDINKIEVVQKQIEELGLSVYSMTSIRESMQKQLGSTQLLLGGLASISLFVAAIGIANTMVMSIYERTREIGVMKVLGCFLKDIRTMFLIEAGCIGLLGGMVGVSLSLGISWVMNNFAGKGGGGGDIMGGMGMMGDPSMGGGTPMTVIPVWLILLALLFSTLIGIVSGYYPANRAVKISALEAIRTDS